MCIGLLQMNSLVGMIIMKIEIHCQMSKILKHQTLWKQVQWEQICSIRAETQTDMTNVIIISRNFANAPNNSHNPSNIHILCSCNSLHCAADSSCFFTVNRLWYWVADWYKCCVLQTAVASLQSPDCDTEWLIGINVVCCRQQLFRYSHRIVILSGRLV